jgi:hypothetical protein
VGAFQDHERQIAHKTGDENPDEVRLCDLVLDLIWDGFQALGERTAVEDIRLQTTQLLALSANALRWSSEQLVKGYYGLSIASSRVAWECWLNGAYLNLYPERLDEWRSQQKRKRPSPAQMRQLVAERTHEAGGERTAFVRAMNDFYQGAKEKRFSGYSTFAHPSWEAVRILVRSDADGYWLRVSPDYDVSLFRLSFQLFCAAGSLAASLFVFLLQGPAQEAFLLRALI